MAGTLLKFRNGDVGHKIEFKIDNLDWKERHENDIKTMLENLPHGSGLDAEVEFNWEKSNGNKLVFEFSFHHMADGYYSGWTKHKLNRYADLWQFLK